MHSFRVIDSHTGGEPTRTIVSGGPLLDRTFHGDARAGVRERLGMMQTHFDHYRRALVNEPRGSDVMVGALIVPPSDPAHLAGVIFFNNVGYLGMCGHGTIGVVETLRYLGQMKPGTATLETCVGTVQVALDSDHRVTVENVPSYRAATRVPVSLPNEPAMFADIAYGGNWFCLIECPDPSWLDRPATALIALTQRILQTVREQYPQVDHVELFAPPKNPPNHSRSFVLCPGGAYDRSPCGTGTSAKLACLAADGKLAPEALWRQESFIGSVFEARYRRDASDPEKIIPSITARAFVTADANILVDDHDEFGWGIP